MPLHGFLSRRDFLKLGGATFLGLLISDLGFGHAAAAPIPLQGRVVYTRLVVRDAPSFQGRKINSLTRDTLLNVAEQVWGGVEGDYNRLWYRISQTGYVYSGGVQPVQTRLNDTVTDLPSVGVVGQVTIPFADSLWDLNSNPVPGPRLYYATAHWIKDLVADKRDGSLWYKAYDQLNQAYYYTRPEWVHILAPEELAPLSPDVQGEEKHIEILLDQQLLLAFEGEALVHAARTATGQRGFETPVGEFTTFHKRPTAHMVGGADEFSMFDLPAIPWCSYITDTGVALHGTYWHNDFGHTHSHGCVNLSPEDARWVYRWTLPEVPAGERLLYQPGTGTRVRVLETQPPPV
jgi:lipoprotein-anchoring transpeptidase ErfK/SrfK